MTKGIRLSRKQIRTLKRKLAASTMSAIMVASLSMNSVAVFAQSLPAEQVTQEQPVIQSEPVTQEAQQPVQTASKGMLSSRSLSSSGQTTTINISELNPSTENNEINYTISESGTYAITGTNYRNDGGQTSGGVYIPTSIVVKEGVKATLYLNGVTIINNNGKGYDGPPSSDGSTVTNKKATLPLSIEKNADVTLQLTGDSEFGINEYGSAFDVAEGAKVTLEASNYQLKISECNPNTYMDDTYAMNLFGTFVMNGSHLMVTGNCNDDRIALNGTGRMTVNGGYFDFDRMSTVYDKEDRFVINGGQFNSECCDSISYEVTAKSIHNFVEVTGLPVNTSVTMCQQFYMHGDEKVEYGVENVTTDGEGSLYVDAGRHNLVKEAWDDFTMIIKCGDNYYEVKYDPSAYQYSDWTLTATLVNAYKINFYSAGETPVFLDTIYTTVNSAVIAEYHYAGNYVAHSYKFYSSNNTTGEEFDFKLTASETNVYVVEGEKGYAVDVMFPGGGDKSYNIPYGKNIAEYLNVDGIDIDDYILIDSPTASSSQIWDGYPERNMTVFAHPCVTVDNERYMKISSANDMEAFRNYVNGGCTSLNGYLTENIDVGGFDGIYGGIGADEQHPYTGKFLGNRHTIKLAMKNNDKSGSDSTCALFRYVGNGCELKGIDTAGTIYTKGKYAGGLVGTAKVLDGSILIDSCSSSVIITYDLNSQNDAWCGGLVGCMSSNRYVEHWDIYDIHGGTITIRNCYYGGEMKKGQNAVNFKKQGGLIGLNDDCWLDACIENCYVDADFDKTSGDDEYDCLIGGNLGKSISTANFFYTKKCGESGYGEVYDPDSMKVSELAWRLNGGSFTGEYTNSKVWSYKDGSPVFADETNKPIYQVRFVDEGVYDGKDKLDPVYGYTTPESQKVAAPAIPNDYLVAGQSAKWMVNTSEYSSDVTIEADTKAVLTITDTGKYTIEIDGDFEGTFTDVAFGSEISSLFEGGENYIFVSKDSFRHYTKVDGLATRFTAINLNGTQGQRQMDIREASDLAIFAMLVNSGITDIDANLTADIDVSSIPDLAIGESRDCAYKGHFKGNMHTIKIGLVENNEAEATGLFRYLDNCACIEKLTVEGTVKSSATYVGGIAGYYKDRADSDYDKKVSILNCTSRVSIEAFGTEPYVGGILGYGKGNFVVKMCDYCGTIKTKGDAYCSGIAGCVDNYYNYNIFGCYVCMNVDTTGQNKGRNFGYLQDEWESYNDSYEHCYYSGTGYGTQGTYVDRLSYANIYDMNSHAGEDMILMSYYDETSKCVKYCQGTDKAPLRITLTDPGVYENKKYEGFAYTDKDGCIAFPDMSSFLLAGHTAHWYLKDEPATEITEGMKLETECELVLRVTSDVKYTISVSGDKTETLSGLQYGDSLPEDGYWYFTSDGKRIIKVDGSVSSLKAYKVRSIDNKEYLEIGSYDRLKFFRDKVNSGNYSLNGYLTADITVGDDWEILCPNGRERKNEAYQGIFDGNFHTVTMNITETEKHEARALFSYLGDDAVIRNLITTGQIKSNGKYCAGIAGKIVGDCSIINCGSDIDLIYTAEADGNCNFGGIVGIIDHHDNRKVDINNCRFTGRFVKEGNVELNALGGIVGFKDSAIDVQISNCFVDADFGEASGANFVGNMVYSFDTCYYTNTCGGSAQGVSVTEDYLASAEFAYRLNSTDEKAVNSGVFTYVEEEDYPRFAAGEYKAVSKITFADSEKDSEYAAAWTAGYSAYTDCNGNVVLPDMSEYLADDDKALWYNGEIKVDDTTALTNDTTLELVVQYGRTKALAKLQIAYDEAVLMTEDEQKYTIASYADFSAALAEAKTLLELEDKSAYTDTQVYECLDQLNAAETGLKEAAATLSLKADGAESAVLSGAGRYVAGDMVTLNASDVAGSKFVGWYQGENLVSASAEYEFEVAAEGDIEYTAKYRNLYQYKVSFDGGEGAGSMEEVTVIEDETFTFPVNGFTAPEGKKFKCWEYETAGISTQAQAGDTCALTADMTVKAVWIDARVDYALTLKAENAESAVLSGAGRYAVGELVNLKASEVAGCKFVGWYQGSTPVSESEEYRFEFTANADVEYTAKYRNLYQYKVSFDGAGATGSMAAVTVTEGDSFTFPANAFTAPSGKEFKCWEYEAVGISTQAQAGNTCAVSGDMTVTAVWVDKENEAPIIIITPVTDDTEGSGSGSGTGNTESGTGSGTGSTESGTGTGTGTGTGSGTGSGSTESDIGTGTGSGSGTGTGSTESGTGTGTGTGTTETAETTETTETTEATETTETTEPKSIEEKLSEAVENIHEQFGEDMKAVGTKAEVSDAVSASKKGSVFVDESGYKVKNNFVVTSKGNIYYTNSKGKPVKKTIVTDGENIYYCGKTGRVVKNKPFALPDGTRMLATKTGALVTKSHARVKVDGKYYLTTEGGVLASRQIVKTANGKMYYADKNGLIVTNKTITVDGVKYIAGKKTGALTEVK